MARVGPNLWPWFLNLGQIYVPQKLIITLVNITYRLSFKYGHVPSAVD